VNSDNNWKNESDANGISASQPLAPLNREKEAAWLFNKIKYPDRSEACVERTIISNHPRCPKTRPRVKPIGVTM
jgi:hypothetical protein